MGISRGKLARYFPSFVLPDADPMLSVIVYNLISLLYLLFQRQLDGTNSKRSRLHRWTKSVKILSDAPMEDLKAATRKNKILFL